MQPASILDQLTFADELPLDALRAAADQRADIVPLFVQRIESYVSADSAQRRQESPLFFIFHLLGEWRETSAYRPLASLLRCAPDDIDEILGSAITESAHKVMAAVFDGNPEPIYNIILDENADEYVRSRMCETLAMLVVQNRLDRAEVASFLRDCWIGLQPREACFVWNGWQSAIAMLGLTELKDTVKEAFDRKYIHAGWLAYHHFESDLKHAAANPNEPWPAKRGEYDLIGDTIEELSRWYTFAKADQTDRDRQPKPLGGSVARAEPIVNPLRDVGRNDPCPCGSGKKYKKCCLN